MKNCRRLAAITPTVCLTALLLVCMSAFSAENKEVAEKKDIPAWRARWELARTLSYAKKLDESIAQYEKLLKEKPDLEQAKAEMATVMFWKGKQDEALKILENIPVESMTPEAKRATADLYAAKGKYDKAESLYREHLKTNPKAEDVRFRLAETLSWAKKYKESIKEYETILKSRPDDKQVRRKYALVLSWMGEHEKAAAELKKTLEEESAE